MHYLESPSNNPTFNIALEEYLLKNTDQEYFLLYVDNPSVIVGKHQNTLSEINYQYVIESNIPVIRRISGGGAVYHDQGNLNFCFIANSHQGHQIDFKKYTQPIIEVLQQEYSIPAVLAGKNDIRVNDLKVSGNAEHVFKNRVLHHGTLLVNSKLQDLSQALKVTPGKYTDKAVKSIRSKVANLSEFSTSINITDLKRKLKRKLFLDDQIDPIKLSGHEIQSIQTNVVEKFTTWEWNFAYSPDYRFISGDIEISVEKGIISEANIPGKKELEILLIGKEHHYWEMRKYCDNPWIFF